MQQRDYIMRMIEAVGRMLIALRKMVLGREADPVTVRRQLEQAGRQHGVDLALARGFTPETLVMMVSMGGEVEPGRAWLLAELLYLDGLSSHRHGDSGRADDAFTRALLLYRLIEPKALRPTGFPETRERIAEIEALLENDAPPPAA